MASESKRVSDCGEGVCWPPLCRPPIIVIGLGAGGKITTVSCPAFAQNPEQDIEIRQDDVDPERFNELLRVQRDIVCEVLVVPKVVTEVRELQDDEISYANLIMNSPEVVTEIMTWVRAGCRDVPVPTTNGGNTAVETVANFREGREGGATSGTSPDVRPIPEAAPQ